MSKHNATERTRDYLQNARWVAMRLHFRICVGNSSVENAKCKKQWPHFVCFAIAVNKNSPSCELDVEDAPSHYHSFEFTWVEWLVQSDVLILILWERIWLTLKHCEMSERQLQEFQHWWRTGVATRRDRRAKKSVNIGFFSFSNKDSLEFLLKLASVTVFKEKNGFITNVGGKKDECQRFFLCFHLVEKLLSCWQNNNTS